MDAVKAATSQGSPSSWILAPIGLDLAKTIFQVHGIDASGAVAIRKTLRRSQVLPFFAKLRDGVWSVYAEAYNLRGQAELKV